jgi:hypothetical protein
LASSRRNVCKSGVPHRFDHLARWTRHWSHLAGDSLTIRPESAINLSGVSDINLRTIHLKL